MSSNKEIADTILEQLGGNKFRVMTGAKNFSYSSQGKPHLQFQIGRNASKANMVVIEYEAGHDWYTVKFLKFSMKTGLQELKKVEGVYFDDLRPLFTKYTGLYTSLAG